MGDDLWSIAHVCPLLMCPSSFSSVLAPRCFHCIRLSVGQQCHLNLLRMRGLMFCMEHAMENLEEWLDEGLEVRA